MKRIERDGAAAGGRIAADEKADILIVDDTTTKRAAVASVLEDLGQNIVTAGSGREALRLLLERDFAVILLDVQMPVMDGFETAELIRSRERSAHTPIIFVTSHARAEADMMRGYRLGAVDYIFTPLVREILRAKAGVFVDLHHKTRKIEKHEARLLEANRFLDSVIENIPDMIFVKDAADLRFVRINRAGEALLGYPRETLLGGSDHDFFPAEQADFFVSNDREVLACGQVRDIPEETIQTRTRGRRILHTKKIPILDERDRPRYLLGISQDVTQRKEREQEILRLNSALEQRAAEVEAANRAKSTFLSTMSHEIRTPMNGVLGMLELLGMTKLDAEQRATLEVVRESGMSLLRIIDDILDFSKIEAGKLEVRPEPASVERIVQQTLGIFSGNASSKGLRLAARVDSRIGAALWLDPLRVQQILNNFVSNAIKFTAKGGIEIAALLVERREAEELLRFSVKDSGMGISAADQQRLFQPFSQIAGRTANEFGGTGLGLSICRRLAVLMGGSVEMASEPGVGTTMTLTLAAKRAPEQEVPRARARASSGAIRDNRRGAPSVVQAEAEGTLVLVVDDHPVNCMVLLRQVNALGYAAETADNGRSALTKLESGRFGLVLTDCHMPEMDGYELARRFRRTEAEKDLRRTPMIACTASAMAGDADACLAAGMDDYLPKPVELRELMAKLDRWLPIPAQPSDGGDDRSSR